jgi:hypothetical protein
MQISVDTRFEQVFSCFHLLQLYGLCRSNVGLPVQITDADHIDRLMSCLNMALPFYVVFLCSLVHVNFFWQLLVSFLSVLVMVAAVSPSLH